MSAANTTPSPLQGRGPGSGAAGKAGGTASIDPRLWPIEREALERLAVSKKKGGEGWHPQSASALHAARMLDAGETRDEADNSMLLCAMRLMSAARKRQA